MTQPNKLMIVGAGGHGKVAADCAQAMACFDEIVFADAVYPSRKQHLNWPIVGDDSFWLKHINDYLFVVAIGPSDIRARVQQKIQQAGGKLTSLIHPSAQISQYATVGKGSVVFANSVINADSHIGEACIINTAATIDHDCQVGAYCHIAPGANISGGVTIGQHSWLGVGSCVIELINIGKNIKVGAGAAVCHDLIDAGTYVGIPAKSINSTHSSLSSTQDH